MCLPACDLSAVSCLGRRTVTRVTHTSVAPLASATLAMRNRALPPAWPLGGTPRSAARLSRPPSMACSRRQAHASAASLAALLLSSAPPHRAMAQGVCPPASKASFVSAAFDQPNYANAVVASRDTNVSPKEAYDVIASRAQPPDGVTCPRALDLGAGAGVSTQILWLNGFRDIEAIDPSREAWDRYVSDPLPPGVRFEQTSDEGFIERRAADAPLYDLVLVNFAINADKARSLLTLLEPNGRLLAPVNTQRNYWFRQQCVPTARRAEREGSEYELCGVRIVHCLLTGAVQACVRDVTCGRYRLIDRAGEVLWSADTSGGWQITFQPDFTEPACQGQWCPQFRGAGDNTLKLR